MKTIDKYRLFYGVDKSHELDCEFFEKLRDAKAFMFKIKGEKSFTLYKFDVAVWDSEKQSLVEDLIKCNEYRRKHGYPLLDELRSRYSI